MKREEIIELLIGLSHSQGRWGRILETLHQLREEDNDYYNLLLTTWEECNFDQLGFVLFIEEEPVNEWSVEDINRWLEKSEK